MTSSDDFKRALKAGNLTEALTLAMGKIIELNIVTTVADSEDQSHPWEQVKVKPGCRMQTHIDLVQGDIANEIGEQFLSGGTYEELRKFHLQQVVQGNITIQENLESLQKLLGLWLAVNQAYSNPKLPFDQSGNLNILATETDLDYPIHQEVRKDIPSLPTKTEQRTEVQVISGTKPEEVQDLSTVDNLKQSDDFDGWDEAIFDLLSSFPDTPDPEIEAELEEIAPEVGELGSSDSFPPTPKPEMPVADLEVEDWEIAVQEQNGASQGQPQLQIVSLDDFTIEPEPEDVTEPSQEEEIQAALDSSLEVTIIDKEGNGQQAVRESQEASVPHRNDPISQEPLESLSNLHNNLIQQNGESVLDALESATWFEDDWGEVPAEEENNGTSEENSSTLGDRDVQDSPSEASFVETRVVDDELGFLFEEEDLVSDNSASSPQPQNKDTLPSRWELEEDELSAVFEDDLFGSLPIRAKRQDKFSDRTKEQDSD